MSVPKSTDTSEAVEAVLSSIADGCLAPVSLVRNSDLIRGFANFLATTGVASLSGVDRAIAESYVTCLTRTGSDPSIATMRLRRSALRLLFREAKALGLAPADPTIDIVLPSRSYGRRRPLTNPEIEKCRSFAEGMRGDSRYAIAWALAEATARVPELTGIARRDISEGTLTLPGCSMTDPRVVRLTEWGAGQVERLQPGDGLALQRGSNGSFHELIAATLRRAGLGKKPGVSPTSVPAWRGASELANGASIDEVTRLLGMRSLDRAAAFVGFDWRADA